MRDDRNSARSPSLSLATNCNDRGRLGQRST